MQQKLSNYTLHKATYGGFSAETMQTTTRFEGNGNGFAIVRGFHQSCMSFLVTNLLINSIPFLQQEIIELPYP